MRRTRVKIIDAERGIGIAAASSLIERALLTKALKQFAGWGIPTRIDDDIYEKLRSFAGTDERRANSLIRLAKDPTLGAIWCARGGYGAARILARLDKAGLPSLLKRSPKLLLGFSDVTALHFYFGALGLPTVHAPMPATPSWSHMTPRVHRLLHTILAGGLELGRKSYTAEWKIKPIYMPRGGAEGILRGGNLSLLASLAGTPWQPDLRGSLLMLEDCGERPYRVDRMLTQIASAGMLKGVRGVLLGDFEADVEYKHSFEKRYWNEIFAERFEGIPLVKGLPVGHGKRNEPLPLGVKAALDGSGKLLLLEQPVTG
ncbi:MAG: LD-carboxypeptidase [Bacteriovoracia bacterium]